MLGFFRMLSRSSIWFNGFVGLFLVIAGTIVVSAVDAQLNTVPGYSYEELKARDCHRTYQWWDYEVGTCRHFVPGYGGDGKNYVDPRNPMDDANEGPARLIIPRAQ